MAEKKIGVVSHYYGHINVAAIELSDGDLKVGDTIHITGHTTDLVQEIASMQIEHEPVDGAPAGSSIGVRVSDHVREHDEVYKIVEG